MESKESASSEKQKRIVPDTSILINGKLTEMIEKGKLSDARIIIPKAVIDELQAQASTGKEIGFKGLGEIKKLKNAGGKHGIIVEFTGERPTVDEIALAKKGRIDAIIRDVAKAHDAVLFTADYVQALVAEVEGIAVEHIPKEISHEVKIEKFFTPDTQSVHLKTGVIPLAKKGKPGSVILEKIGTELMIEDELESIINDVVDRARREDDAFVEINKKGALVIQLGSYRIAITKPPFSDGLELTAVRPIIKLTLADYNLHKDLEEAVKSGTRGILIAGAPGNGKSSFASALAEFIQSHGKIVKTFEQPRDLQVGPEITEYGPLEGDWAKSAEILLLVRPDYTIFDEIRHTKDFIVYADMRLAGVGMIGVIHATSPVSAIQRFIGRVELGIIPHVIDTVIFIDKGQIEKVYELSLTVKMPTGMKEADLARPVVEIRDHATKRLEYEIYTFGEEKVIIPVEKERSPVRNLAKEIIYSEVRKYDDQAEIEIVDDNRVAIRMDSEAIGRFIGKQGTNIERIEKRLGIGISVEPKEGTFKNQARYELEEAGKFLLLRIGQEVTGSQVDIYDGETCIGSMLVGKKGIVRVRRDSEIGKAMMQAWTRKRLKIAVGK